MQISRTVAVVALALSMDGTAQAAPQKDRVYYTSIRCMFANKLAGDSRRRAGDTDGAARYDAKAKEAYGVANVLGDAAGISSGEIQRDMDGMMQSELDRMMHEPGYFKSVVASCKAVELM